MSDLRIAWVFPSLRTGNYWHPVFSRFTTTFRKTVIYTGLWTGFSPGFENTFSIQVVGKTKFLETKVTDGYSRGVSYVSPKIIIYLLRFRPQVIFTMGFSIWTLFIVLLKPLCRWRIVIVYDGSSPNIDCLDSPFRIWLRRIMISLSNACITNTQAGRSYLTRILKAKENCVFQQPYEVPDSTALLKVLPDSESMPRQSQRPVFLFVGQLIQRKGLSLLLQACVILQSWGYRNYGLQVIGQGSMEEELKAFSQQHNLPVDWIGWVDYGKIGNYFRNADVFVLPTLEDTWGMVVLESMVFSKPVLCSKWAGASEMISHGENGYLFDPNQPEDLAKTMRHIIEHPDLITTMGEKSKQVIAQHTPETAAKFLTEVALFAIEDQ
ncbi:MAG: glycosyltransferase family 4 protein [Tildeniella nuda ZEHNDER 1965/U140]|jgi:glycosyltransferase involved in cell wall biosynthesis|nr:glycosyltransferase family 4 protein [Tildeniella nuda ZEHNDER 1965/U140]